MPGWVFQSTGMNVTCVAVACMHACMSTGTCMSCCCCNIVRKRQLHLTRGLRARPVEAVWGMPCAPPSMQRRTPTHHPHTAGLLPAALRMQLPHTCPPSTPTQDKAFSDASMVSATFQKCKIQCRNLCSFMQILAVD